MHKYSNLAPYGPQATRLMLAGYQARATALLTSNMSLKTAGYKIQGRKMRKLMSLKVKFSLFVWSLFVIFIFSKTDFVLNCINVIFIERVLICFSASLASSADDSRRIV